MSTNSYSNWYKLAALQCLSRFGGTLMNIYATLQLNSQHEMKYCAAWDLFALRHKSKSTYCSIHADTNATGWNLQAKFVQVWRFKFISVKRNMFSKSWTTLLWSSGLILHLALIIWFHVIGCDLAEWVSFPLLDQTFSLHSSYLVLGAPGWTQSMATLNGCRIPDTLK